MLRTLSAGVLIAVFAFTVCGDEPNLNAELRALQGNWKPAALKYEEFNTMPEEMLRQVTGVYDKDEFHLYYVDRSRDGSPLKLMVAKAAFDSATKTMSFECERGALRGHKLHGIYELTDTTLKLCYGPTDKPRPTAFNTPKGSGCFYEV